MADGSRHIIYMTEEDVYGVTNNNPALDTLRITGTTLGLAKDSLQSEELRSDRQIDDFRLGANQVAGEIRFELSYGSFDKLLEAVLLSEDWSSPATTGAASIDATATGFERATGSFLTDGFAVGQTVASSGYLGSGYNGLSVVTALDALTMTTTPLSGSHGVESGTGDETVTASARISSGTTRRSFTFIRHFEDIEAPLKGIFIYKGCEINSLQFTIGASSMVTGTMTVVGQSQEIVADLSSLGTPTYNAATSTSPLDSFTSTLEENGNVIAVITEVSFTMQNGLEPRFVVGSKNSIKPSVARSNLTGQITAFFEDSVLVEKFINETESGITVRLPDLSGNYQTQFIPRIKYTGGQPDVTGEGSVTLNMPFQALRDRTLLTNYIIERSPSV